MSVKVKPFDEKKKDQLLDYNNPVYAQKQASSFIGESFYYVFSPYGEQGARFHLLNQSGDQYQDSSAYRQVTSSPRACGVEIQAGKSIGMLQPGDKISICGNDWAVQSIDIGQKIIALQNPSNGEQMILQDGQRLNLQTAGQQDYNWKVNFGADNLKSAYTGISNIYSNKIWIYNEDDFIGARFVQADGLRFPSSIGAKIFYDGLVNNNKTRFMIASEPNTSFKLSSGEIVTADAISLSGTFGLNPYAIPSSQRLYVLPERGSYLYKKAGASTYDEISFSSGLALHFQSGLLDELSIDLDSKNKALYFYEKARPSDYNVQPVYSALSFYSGSNGYQFKKSDSSTVFIQYHGLSDSGTSLNSFELPVTSERGSVWDFISKTDASFMYSTEIARSQWSLSVPGQTTSVSDYGRIVKAGSIFNDVQLYPNPASGIVNLRFDLDGQNADVRVTNNLGQEVLPVQTVQGEGNKSVQLDVSGLPSGMYYVKLHDNTGHQTIVPLSVVK